MRPHKSKPKKELKLGYKLLYGIAVILIAGVWIYAFKSYFSHYDSLHPEITWAVPWVQVDMATVDGVFLWNESRIGTPRAGKVSYPKGQGPVRVEKGAVVARITSGQTAHDIKTPQEGYFVAGTDGQEGYWRYASLWPGITELPKAAPLSLIPAGTSLKSGEAVGKIIPQPQELRFIGYADLTGNLEKNLESNRIMIKMDPLDTPSRAGVRVYEVLGYRAKMYLNLPWFPPSALMSRNYKLIIEMGASSGVAIPESSVMIKDGARGAFVLMGSDAVFTKITGRSIGNGKYLVTEGLKLGDAVIVDAHSAKEGRVKLW